MPKKTPGQVTKWTPLWIAGLAVAFAAMGVYEIWQAGHDRGILLIAFTCGLVGGVVTWTIMWRTRDPGRQPQPLTGKQTLLISMGPGVGGILLSIGPDWLLVALGGLLVPVMTGVAFGLRWGLSDKR